MIDNIKSFTGDRQRNKVTFALCGEKGLQEHASYYAYQLDEKNWPWIADKVIAVNSQYLTTNLLAKRERIGVTETGQKSSIGY